MRVGHRDRYQRVLSEHGVTAGAVLNRVMREAGLTKDSELAELFGVSNPTITTWRKRNRIPFEEVLAICFERKWDFIYCLLGRSSFEVANNIELNRKLSEEEMAKAQETFARAARMIERYGWPPKGDKQGDN